MIADGLSLWQGAQFAIDTTLVSPPPTADLREGEQFPVQDWHWNKPRRRKEATNPEQKVEKPTKRRILKKTQFPSIINRFEKSKNLQRGRQTPWGGGTDAFAKKKKHIEHQMKQQKTMGKYF